MKEIETIIEVDDEQSKLAERAAYKYNESTCNRFDDNPELAQKAKCVKVKIGKGVFLVTSTNAVIRVVKSTDSDGSEYLIGCLEEAGDDNNEKLLQWLKDPSFYYHGRCWD